MLHGFPNNGFENGIINQLNDGTFELVIHNLVNTTTRSVNALNNGSVGQLAARQQQIALPGRSLIN